MVLILTFKNDYNFFIQSIFNFYINKYNSIN